LKSSIRFPGIVFFLLLVLLTSSCQQNPKTLVEKTLDAREDALNSKNIDAYMTLIGKDYQYKSEASTPLREGLASHFNFFDSIHIRTYNRLIYFEGKFADITQDFQMSVMKDGKAQVFSGAEYFVFQKQGGLFPKWLFIKGLDTGGEEPKKVEPEKSEPAAPIPVEKSEEK
jgi:hypothetical protein